MEYERASSLELHRDRLRQLEQAEEEAAGSRDWKAAAANRDQIKVISSGSVSNRRNKFYERVVLRVFFSARLPCIFV